MIVLSYAWSGRQHQTGLAARDPAPTKGHATNKKKPKCTSRKRWPWKQEVRHLVFLLFLRKICKQFHDKLWYKHFLFIYKCFIRHLSKIESYWVNICHLFTSMWALNQYSIALAVAWDMSSEWQRRAFIIVTRVCRSKFLRNRCRAVRKVNAAFRGRIESCRRAPSLLPSVKRHFH